MTVCQTPLRLWHTRFMPKRSSKKDTAQNALRVVEQAIGEELVAPRKKNPAAVALGRLGGKVGGKARAAKLTSERKREIASDAARVRWSKEKENRPKP
jgi:hypothetical protein